MKGLWLTGYSATLVPYVANALLHILQLLLSLLSLLLLLLLLLLLPLLPPPLPAACSHRVPVLGLAAC